MVKEEVSPSIKEIRWEEVFEALEGPESIQWDAESRPGLWVSTKYAGVWGVFMSGAGFIPRCKKIAGLINAYRTTLEKPVLTEEDVNKVFNDLGRDGLTFLSRYGVHSTPENTKKRDFGEFLKAILTHITRKASGKVA